MTRDAIQDNWTHLAGHAKRQWNKLTDEDLQSIAGRRLPLSGKIQERYGVGREEAEKQMVAWEQTMNDTVLAKRSD
jgi:uncharacterized protein YjbJ (UPF0337 family)